MNPTIVELWTEEEVFEIYKIPKKTLANWRCKGKGPSFVKIGNAIRYRPEDLKAFLDARVFKSTTEYSVFRAEEQRERGKVILSTKR